MADLPSRQSSKIPQTVMLHVCETCGRTDRWNHFSGSSHYSGGKRCSGKPISVVYRRSS